MPNLIDIRRRVKSVKNTQQITKAMKMVSASKLRRASEKAVASRPFVARLASIHQSILALTDTSTNPYYRSSEARGKVLVVMAGDKGLCGSFNSNVYKAVFRFLAEHGSEETQLVLVGKKACQKFAKGPAKVLAQFPGILREVNQEAARELLSVLMAAFQTDEIGEVHVVYNEFHSALSQVVTFRQLMPLTAQTEEAGFGTTMAIEPLAEPSREAILERLTPGVLMTTVLQALLESVASEHAARMTAMDAATNNAIDMEGRLTLEMNKARQAAITTELIEIVSGAAAL
jgi:F-type H+-transporting ATPase subunit gamma